MSIKDDLNTYENVKEFLKFHAISAVRLKIMIILFHGPQRTKELKGLTGVESSSISHAIKNLEKEGIVSRKGDYFYLSELGEILVPQLASIIKTQYVLKKFQRLWLDHTTEAIPQDLLMNIGDLSYSQFLESEPTDIYKTHEKHIQVVKGSKELKGVSPIFYPIYTEVFNSIIENGVKVELILTDEVLKRTLNSQEHGIEDMKKLLSTGNLTIWKIKDAKVAFTVTDKLMTLGLFLSNGMYDSNRLLVSDHNDSLAWANKLFEYYRQKAEKFEL
ncbi:MAG TPA: transcriptional regulator FilR1 domain-containing protein [Methanobacterium sp.]|nr:transcriptional regulator FilR1 domain-containing protein [Methanobacterium sp.]